MPLLLKSTYIINFTVNIIFHGWTIAYKKHNNNINPLKSKVTLINYFKPQQYSDI